MSGIQTGPEFDVCYVEKKPCPGRTRDGKTPPIADYSPESWQGDRITPFDQAWKESAGKEEKIIVTHARYVGWRTDEVGNIRRDFQTHPFPSSFDLCDAGNTPTEMAKTRNDGKTVYCIVRKLNQCTTSDYPAHASLVTQGKEALGPRGRPPRSAVRAPSLPPRPRRSRRPKQPPRWRLVQSTNNFFSPPQLPLLSNDRLLPVFVLSIQAISTRPRALPKEESRRCASYLYPVAPSPSPHPASRLHLVLLLFFLGDNYPRDDESQNLVRHPHKRTSLLPLATVQPLPLPCP